MIVIFKNIPPTTQKTQLLAFIKPAMKKRSLFYRLFSLPGTIVDITLHNLLDKESSVINTNSLVTIVPDDIASLIIEQLDRKVINGRRISVREYHIRSEQNDPRKSYGNIPQDVIDQRVGDRRQFVLLPC